MALAQQYGIPTRLLDWTDRPPIAAYFAAREAAQGLMENRLTKSGHPVTHLAVWCINVDWVVYEGWPVDSGKTPSVLVITAPRASNPNLHAQGGIFITEAVDPYDPDPNLRPEPLNERVARRWRGVGGRDRVMRHLTMPVGEAGKLLRLLHEENVSAATVYPGFKGVADSMNERQFWDKAVRLSYWLPRDR
jgi:FRG domain